MKKLVLIVTMCLFSTFALAQIPEPGSLDFLKDHKSVKVEVDYSQAIINNMDYETRCEQDPDWKKNENEVTGRFISALSQELSSHNLMISKKSDLVLVVKLTRIDEDGECYANAEFQDLEGNVLGVLKGLNGDGGKWGSLTNLASDGMEELAKDVGSVLNKYKRATKKASKKK